MVSSNWLGSTDYLIVGGKDHKSGEADDGDIRFEAPDAWIRLSFHANVFQIHGRGLSRTDIGNLMPVSSIEALATTRLLSRPDVLIRISAFPCQLSLQGCGSAISLFTEERTFGSYGL